MIDFAEYVDDNFSASIIANKKIILALQTKYKLGRSVIIKRLSGAYGRKLCSKYVAGDNSLCVENMTMYIIREFKPKG